jgi:arylsulfatase A
MSTQNNAAPSHENPTNFVPQRHADRSARRDSRASSSVHEAVRWMKELRDKSKPFFLSLSAFHEPHEPVASPAESGVASIAAAGERGPGPVFRERGERMDRAVGQAAGRNSTN